MHSHWLSCTSSHKLFHNCLCRIPSCLVLNSITPFLTCCKNRMGHWTTKLGIQMAGHNKSFQSLAFELTQLHFGQWSSLPIQQWPARIFTFIYCAHDGKTRLWWAQKIQSISALLRPFPEWLSPHAKKKSLCRAQESCMTASLSKSTTFL